MRRAQSTRVRTASEDVFPVVFDTPAADIHLVQNVFPSKTALYGLVRAGAGTNAGE